MTTLVVISDTAVANNDDAARKKIYGSSRLTFARAVSHACDVVNVGTCRAHKGSSVYAAGWID